MRADYDRLRKLTQQRAESMMKQNNLDALLVTTMDNVTYLTGDRLYLELDWYVDQYAALLTADGRLVKWVFDVTPLTASDSYGWKSYPLLAASVVPERWAGLFANPIKELGLSSGRIGLDCMSFAIRTNLQRDFHKLRYSQLRNCFSEQER